MASARKLANPIHITDPYDITINTDREAAEYIMRQCNNCPKYASNWDCSGERSYKCKAVTYNLMRDVKAQTETFSETTTNTI